MKDGGQLASGPASGARRLRRGFESRVNLLVLGTDRAGNGGKTGAMAGMVGMLGGGCAGNRERGGKQSGPKGFRWSRHAGNFASCR